MGIYLVLVSQVYSFARLFDETLGAGSITINVLLYLPIMIYYPLLEYFLKGKTLGKFIMGIRVTNKDGSLPSLFDYLLRWLMRGFDVKIGLVLFFLTPIFWSDSTARESQYLLFVFMFIPFPLIGLISMALTKNTQRLGDIIANTVVLQKSEKASLKDTILINETEEHQVKYKEVLQLRDKDIYILKKIVERAENQRDFSRVKELSDKAKERLKIKNDELPLPFLKQLLKDYNHLAKKKDLK